MSELRLCYVRDNWAWFTSDFENQRGDDWNDAPYEHNASDPHSRSGVELIKVAFDGPFERPSDYGHHSRLSVDDINEKQIAPWLKIDRCWMPVVDLELRDITVYGGCDFALFRRMVKRAGGNVYHAT